MKQKTGILLLVLLLLLALSGCSSGEVDPEEVLPEGTYRVYYVNIESMKLVATAYEAEAENTESVVQELLKQLRQEPESKQWASLWTESLEIKSCTLKNGILTLYFNSAYQNTDAVSEILFRASVVKTLIQLPGVSGVQFMVNDQPLMDASKTAVGVMRAESFLEDTGGQVSKEQTATLVLYFTNKEGTELISTEQRVRYSTNYSLEKAVVTQLLKGPAESGLYPTLPSETTLLGISVKDGVCYVDFDETFLDNGLNVAEYIPIYSLVNSLSELTTVNKVQITVNGSSDYTFLGVYPLKNIYERNLDYKGGTTN